MEMFTDVIYGTLLKLLTAYLVSDLVFVEARGGRFSFRGGGGYRGGAGGGGTGEYAWISGVIFGAMFLAIIIYVIVQVCKKQLMKEKTIKIKSTYKGKPVKCTKPGLVISEHDSHSIFEEIKIVPKNAVAPKRRLSEGDIPLRRKKATPQPSTTSPPPPYDRAFSTKEYGKTKSDANATPGKSVPPPAYYKAMEV